MPWSWSGQERTRTCSAEAPTLQNQQSSGTRGGMAQVRQLFWGHGRGVSGGLVLGLRGLVVRRLLAVCVAAVTATAGLSLGAGPVLGQSGGLEPNLSAYPDVGEDAYYYVPVVALAEGGVFDGTDRTRCRGRPFDFCPDEPIDRETMAVWVVRVLDGRAPAAVTESRFADVDGAGWRAAYIERMADLGVTHGCGDGSRFCPDDMTT